MPRENNPDETTSIASPLTIAQWRAIRKAQMHWAEKVGVPLAGLWVVAAVSKITPSPEWSPLQPYDGIVWFWWIAAVGIGAFLHFYGAWRNKKSRDSSYEGETL